MINLNNKFMSKIYKINLYYYMINYNKHKNTKFGRG